MVLVPIRSTHHVHGSAGDDDDDPSRPENRPRIKNLVVLVINLQLAIMSAEGIAKKSRQSAESRRPASRHSESRG